MKHHVPCSEILSVFEITAFFRVSHFVKTLRITESDHVTPCDMTALHLTTDLFLKPTKYRIYSTSTVSGKYIYFDKYDHRSLC